MRGGPFGPLPGSAIDIPPLLIRPTGGRFFVPIVEVTVGELLGLFPLLLFADEF